MTQKGSNPPTTDVLSARLKWRAITLATLVLVPGFWALLAGLVSATSKDSADAPNAAAALALGLAVMPFSFMVLAFLSQTRNAPRAVLKAMGMSLIVCVSVSALAMDAVTGIVAGTGAGGAIALRAAPTHSLRARAIAVLAVTLYIFVLVRTVGGPVLLFAPILPFTAIGIADHFSEGRHASA